MGAPKSRRQSEQGGTDESASPPAERHGWGYGGGIRRALCPPPYSTDKSGNYTSDYVVKAPSDEISCFSDELFWTECGVLEDSFLHSPTSLRHIASKVAEGPPLVPFTTQAPKKVKQVVPSSDNSLLEFDALSSIIMTEVCIPCDSRDWRFSIDIPARLEKHTDKHQFQRVINDCNQALPRGWRSNLRAYLHAVCACHKYCDKAVYKATRAAKHVQSVLDAENQSCWRNGLRWRCTVCTVGKTVTLALRIQVSDAMPKPKIAANSRWAQASAWD
mmetsp:Transcript_35815/g.82204  ORF Transcript_35815/g.82204 Transcript_35815/m.82204 type:complete len:274 (-) Transcript_35815:49-870(-)